MKRIQPTPPLVFGLVGGVLFLFASRASAGPFVHPGMLQTREELQFMKKQAAAGQEPWKTAWANLCAEPYSSLSFEPRPFVHVVRGANGRPSIGDRDLMQSANAAYSQALQWVVTGDRSHAQKAIEILNAWSSVLWDFDDNDAKLLAGWTGHALCNAAEILRYTDAGWREEDMAQFKRMLLTVYYPLIRDYFPQANGNWDAAMMDTTLCIGIFCDDHAIFDRAVDHFERGQGNAGITRYVYPDGQCEETDRDQNHTQLGLGELAQACAVAWNQRVDLYGAADNRLAVGFEYTAKYMLGDEVPAYGVISAKGRGHFSDIYEGVYQHYHGLEGIALPFTERAVQKARESGGWEALILCHAPFPASSKPAAPDAVAPQLTSSLIAADAGARGAPTAPAPANAVKVAVGEPLQAAVDAHGNGGTLLLEKGVFVLPKPLRLQSGITLAGQGRETVLMLDPAVGHAAATIVNGQDSLHDVTLRDLVIEGGTTVRTPDPNIPGYDSVSGSAATLHPLTDDPNQDRRQRSSSMSPSRAAIVLNAQHDGQMHNLRLEHVTVRNCTSNGVAIRGASQVAVIDCDLSDNGSAVVPGNGLEHNLLLTHVDRCQISGSRLDDSPWGSGAELLFVSNVTLSDDELARNARNGVHVAESHDIQVSRTLVEGNDRDGVATEILMDPCRNIDITDTIARNNGRCGIALDPITCGTLKRNTIADNGVRP